MFRPSKNTRVLLVIAAMAAASFSVGGGVYAWTSGDAARLRAAQEVNATVEDLAHGLVVAMNLQESATDDYVLGGSPVAARRFEQAVAREAALAQQLRGLKPQPRVQAAVDAVGRASMNWRADVGRPALRAVERDDAAGIARFRGQAADDHTAIEAGITALRDELAVVDGDLERQQADAASAVVVGVVFAFAFLLVAFGVALVAVRRFGRTIELEAQRANVLNRFTELTSFTTGHGEIAAANLVALRRLVAPDHAVTHILNRSLDRAVPEATFGDPVAEILPLHALERCAGVLRGTMYVADDLGDDLSVHCQVYPAERGTLACVPLSSGESVGAVHLYWNRPGALPLGARPAIARITEHAALAIGNQRLLEALHGQANTDPRTGLANSRSFDVAVEAALAARARDDTVSILMLDVDHFKQFNDRHGHPAGDEALRVFAGVLRSCMRDGDLAARYGGEEFAVFVRGDEQGSGVATAIAERIRARTEATILPLAPGLTDRITVSIGIATAPGDGTERAGLLRGADAALYLAKASGRNRVVSNSADDTGSRPHDAPELAGESQRIATRLTRHGPRLRSSATSRSG